MGGGGFSTHPPDPALDDFVLGLAQGRREPRICLLPTAGGDAQEQIVRFQAAFDDRACVASHLSLFRLGRRPVSLREHLLGQDIIGAARDLIGAHGIEEVGPPNQIIRIPDA